MAPKPSATRRAGQQTAPLPSWLDQVAAAEAVCAVFLREGIGETSYHRLCCWYLRDAWFALLGHRCPDRFLIRLRHRRYWLRRCRLPHRHDMHDRWRRGGRNGLHILWRKKLRWLGSEAFRPGFGGHAPRCWTRLILDRPRPFTPDVYDFDHSALAGSGTTSPRRAKDVALFTAQGLGTLPFPGWENAICF